MSCFEHEKPSAVEASERKLSEIAAYRAWLFFRVIGGFSYKDKVMSEMARKAFTGWLGDAYLIDPGKNTTSMWGDDYMPLSKTVTCMHLGCRGLAKMTDSQWLAHIASSGMYTDTHWFYWVLNGDEQEPSA